MRTFHYRYPVKLSEEQRRWLEAMIHMSSTPTKHYLVARILLMSGQNPSEPSHTDGQIKDWAIFLQEVLEERYPGSTLPHLQKRYVSHLHLAI